MSKRVMLIQDTAECTEIMRLLLEEEGIEVLSAKSAQDICNASNCDLLVIDEFSKGKTGCQLCKQLKTGKEFHNKPIVLTSTGIGLSNFRKDCSADIYLQKPFDIYYFVTLIKNLLN